MTNSDGPGFDSAVERLLLDGADPNTVFELIEMACERGACRALTRCGLIDDCAPRDIRELRDLLSAWRSARRLFWQTVLRWLTTAFVAFLIAAFAHELRIFRP